MPSSGEFLSIKKISHNGFGHTNDSSAQFMLTLTVMCLFVFATQCTSELGQ